MEIINLFLVILVSFFISFLKSYQIIFIFLLLCIFTHYLRENWESTLIIKVRDFCNNPFGLTRIEGIRSNLSKDSMLSIVLPFDYLWDLLEDLNKSYVSGRNILFVKTSKGLMETFAPKELGMMAPVMPLGIPQNLLQPNKNVLCSTYDKPVLKSKNDLEKTSVFKNEVDMLKFLENLKKD